LISDKEMRQKRWLMIRSSVEESDGSGESIFGQTLKALYMPNNQAVE
jgi:hypothetical protein